MHGCGSPAEKLGVAVKPLVNSLVDGVVFIANLLGSRLFLDCFDFSGSSILVRAANENGIVPAEAAESCIHVSRKNAANDVAQVRHIIYVWQGRGDEYVALAFFRQNLFAFAQPLEPGIRVAN